MVLRGDIRREERGETTTRREERGEGRGHHSNNNRAKAIILSMLDILDTKLLNY